MGGEPLTERENEKECGDQKDEGEKQMKADHSGKPPLRDDPTTKRGGGESFGKGGRGVKTLIFFRNFNGVPDMKKGVSLVAFLVRTVRVVRGSCF